MRPSDAILNILVLVITSLVTVVAFRRPDLQDKLIFWPERILGRGEYWRLVTSALLHGDWLHLLLNMYSLYVFGPAIELVLGRVGFLSIYAGSVVGGSLLSLYVHRHHDYRALGASGGVCGIIFAYIFLFPGGKIYLFPWPFGLPSWLYALLFVVGSFYGMRQQRDNIGHDAHLGGAIVGLLIATALEPNIVPRNPWLYAAVLGATMIIFLVLALNPLRLPWQSFIRTSTKARPRHLRPRPGRQEPGEELKMDRILEKISRSGIQSLTAREHEFLQRASRQPPREER